MEIWSRRIAQNMNKKIEGRIFQSFRWHFVQCKDFVFSFWNLPYFNPQIFNIFCFIPMKIRLKWWHWCHSSYRLPSMVSSRFLNRLSNLELVTLWFWSTWWNVVSVGWLLRFGRCMLPAVRTLLSSYNYTLTPAARRTRRQQRKCGGCGAIPPQRRYIALPLACNNQLLPFTSTRVGITRKKKKKKTFRAH